SSVLPTLKVPLPPGLPPIVVVVPAAVANTSTTSGPNVIRFRDWEHGVPVIMKVLPGLAAPSMVRGWAEGAVRLIGANWPSWLVTPLGLMRTFWDRVLLESLICTKPAGLLDGLTIETVPWIGRRPWSRMTLLVLMFVEVPAGVASTLIWPLR